MSETRGVRALAVVGLVLPLVSVWAAPEMDWGRIELVRDAWGTPHIHADSDVGGMYGLGYATAEDRGFQMTLSLRLMQGRLAEAVGNLEKVRQGGAGPRNAQELDRLNRTLGWVHAAARTAANLDPETLRLLDAYSRGVNDAFAANAGRLHPLFAETGVAPEPWTPADCVLSWWHFAQFFAGDGLRDLAARPPAAAGRGRAVVDDEAAVVRREDVSAEWIEAVNAFLDAHGLAPGALEAPESPEPAFSHAWVIGGGRTTTGAAVLVSDPQTPVNNPSTLYEFHVQGASFNARGVGVAGSPIILIGFNEQVAWGMTALGADQADLFVLDTDPARPDQYRVDGEWLDMTVRQEQILVRDGQAETVRIRETLFGPEVSDWVFQNPPGQPVALRRVPLAEPDRDTVQGALGMMRADTAAAFAAALPGWRFPSANCVFGDRDGAIGYWSLGALPIRSTLAAGSGSIAQDGSTRKGLWQGMIPYEFLPHVMNPARGYLVSANHRSIQSFYPVPFGAMTGAAGDTDRGLRIKERIGEHLATGQPFTPEDVLAIQFDAVNVWKREVVRLGLRALQHDPEALSEDARSALHYLEPWFEAGARSDASVPGTELVDGMQVIFRGNRSPLVATYGGGVSGLARFAKTVRARDQEFPDGPVPGDEIRFVDQVLASAWQQAERRYGGDPVLWHARAGEMTASQSMGYFQGLDGFPTLDPLQDVPAPALRVLDGATILSQRAQAYTQFVPLHDPDSALTILPPGASEHPASPFRFSTYGDWAQGRLHPAPLSRQAVDAIAVSRRELSRTAPPPPVRGTTRNAVRSTRAAEAPAAALPGRRPDDPELESALRYLLRPERTREEIRDEIERVRASIRDDSARTEEMRLGLELVNHLMRESQAGRLPIVYGTPHALEACEGFLRELARSPRG